ncbi:hypothetical protein SPLC1_S033170 [Arthrospira platensis C1]|nr:hypothetical protein SPLC1_S033170 [Arthrospira platensis C1]
MSGFHSENLPLTILYIDFKVSCELESQPKNRVSPSLLTNLWRSLPKKPGFSQKPGF